MAVGLFIYTEKVNSCKDNQMARAGTQVDLGSNSTPSNGSVSASSVVQIDNIVLAFASDWDLIGVIESHVLNVYGADRIVPGSNVLDLGAGIGDFTILASKRVGTGGRVVAIEPSPDDFKILVKNIEQNSCQNVTALNLALADSEGTSSLEFKDRVFLARRTTLANAIREANLGRVDFVKMDIEGFESIVIPSSIEILGDAHYIAVELHGNQAPVMKALIAEGFSFSPVDTPLITARLAVFLLRHPVLAFWLYSRVKRYPPYTWTVLARRAIKGPSIAQPDKLLVGTFSRSQKSRPMHA